MPESNASKLRRRYPTLESLESAIKVSGSKVQLAKELQMGTQPIVDHQRSLRGISKATQPRTNNCDLTDKEINARIKEMYGGSNYSEVMVYKLTDEYIPGQIGTEGLEFVRIESS